MKVNVNDIEIKNIINDGTFGTHFYKGELYSGIIYEYWKDANQIKTEYEVKDGKQEGIEKNYYKGGSIEIEINYKNGKEDGTSIEYYEDGSIKEKMIFEKGILLQSETFNTNSQLISKYEIPPDEPEYKILERLRNNRM